jgi:hypothetical protein
MASGVGPFEWIAGPSRLIWWAGWFVLFIVAFDGGMALLNWSLGSLGATPPFRSIGYLFILLVALPGLAGLMILVFGALTPMPISSFWISPGGIIIDYGLRTEFHPRDRLHLIGTRLFVFGKWSSLPWAYKVTPYQAARIGFLIPGID